MKTIAKAITNKIVQDGWGNKHRENTDKTLIVGETYLVYNNKIMHMLVPQEILCDRVQCFIESTEESA